MIDLDLHEMGLIESLDYRASSRLQSGSTVVPYGFRRVILDTKNQRLPVLLAENFQ